MCPFSHVSRRALGRGGGGGHSACYRIGTSVSFNGSMATRATTISVHWLITRRRGEGGQNDHGYYEFYFTKESNLKEGKIGRIKRRFFIFFSLSIFYLPLFNSVTKKTIPSLKNIGGSFVHPLAPPPSYAYGDHSSSCSAEVQNELTYASTPPICLQHMQN
jgi:hypothetical protein